MTAAKQFVKCFGKQTIRKVYLEHIAEKSAVGTDGVGKQAFAQHLDRHIDVIQRKVLTGSYKFTRYKEKLVSKGAHSFPRSLSIPTIRDRLVLRCLFNFLVEVFPEARSRLPHDFIRKIRKTLNKVGGKETFVRLDVKEFYPSIDHRKLIGRIKFRIRKSQAIALITSAIETTNQKGTKSVCGVPQGLSISNLLSNLYLIDLDTEFEDAMGLEKYYRYVDDILAIAPPESAKLVFDDIKTKLAERKLSVHPLGAQKGESHICPIIDGIDYLSFTITPSKISIRKSSIARMYNTISAVITLAKHGKNIGRMRWKLDLKITGCILRGKRYGWLHFFHQTEDTIQLAQLDAFVCNMLKRISGLPADYSPKRFIKAYNEIRFRSSTTSYIPNFDTFKREDHVKFLSVMSPRAASGIDSKSDTEVEQLFFKEISRQVSELERDLLEVSS